MSAKGRSKMEKSPARQYEEYARSIQIPTPKREVELSEMIHGGVSSERDLAICELVNGNMRLVLSLAKKYRTMPDYVDVLFDGSLGLVKAATDFDAKKGRFTTHATRRVKTEIRDGIVSRLGAPVSVNRDAMALAIKLKGLGPNEAHGLSKKDLCSAKLAMMVMADAIPLYNENGDPIDLIDTQSEPMMDEIQRNDLLVLVSKAKEDLGMTEDDIELVADSASMRNGHSGVVVRIAQKTSRSQSAVRMRRLKLIWQIRRKILQYVGQKEYLMLSAVGRMPASNWR
jgi:DNA-directed RNA polymerase specialized sigma subunit